MRNRKNRHWLPCILAAVCTMMFLIVLPRADSVLKGTAHDTGETSAVQSFVSGPASNAALSGVPQSSVNSGLDSSNEPQSSVASGLDSSAASSSVPQSSAASGFDSSAALSSAPQSNAASSSASSIASSNVPQSSTASSSVSSTVKKTDYRFENDDVIVTAIPSKPSAMPDGAELCVDPIMENKDPARYLAIENSVTDSLKSTHRSMTGLLAYDIYFSAHGKEIEPGNTAVTIRLKHKVPGGEVGKNAEEIRVLHLKETRGAVHAEDVTSTAAFGAAIRNNSQAQTGRFETDGPSMFALAGVKAMTKAAASLSADEIRSSLAPVLPYAVFADSFTLEGDMEGCIAVNQAAIGGDFGNSDQNFNNCTKSDSVTVKKTYTGTKERTFRFGLYQSDGQPPILIKPITLPAGELRVGSASFPVNGNAGSYKVSELDNNNNPILQGETVDGFTLKSAVQGKAQTGYSGMNCTSYIQSFLSISGSHQLKSLDSKYLPNILVVGSNCTVSGSDVCFGSGIIHCRNSKNVERIPQGQTFPINFTMTLGDMADFSQKLAQVDPSDSIMVKNFTKDQLTESNSNITTNGKLLVINIDATDSPKQLDIPSNFKLTVDGQQQGGWVKAAANVVVNIYARDESGNPIPYSGNISDVTYLMGTLLAPRANITSLGGNYNGTIVAKSVDSNGGELHSADGGYYGNNVIWDFVNAECALALILPETGGPGTVTVAALGIGLLLLGAALALLFHHAVLRKAMIGKLFSGGNSPPNAPSCKPTKTKGETQNTS